MSCGNKTHIVTDAARIIKSPNYPKKYPGGLDCKMLLLVETGSKVAIQFLNFSVEPGDWFGCWDWIDIYDGRNSHADALESRLCGNHFVGKNVIATENSMFITFHSRKGGSRGFFRFRITKGKNFSCI